jgi:hypothetical protein
LSLSSIQQCLQPGLLEERTYFPNRAALAEFIPFIASRGVTSITLLLSDLDQLKKCNDLDSDLADLVILTSFYGFAQFILEQYRGQPFVIHEGGGDDILGLTTAPIASTGPQFTDSLNSYIHQTIPSISHLAGHTHIFGAYPACLPAFKTIQSTHQDPPRPIAVTAPR